jgi:hypothetical protein
MLSSSPPQQAHNAAHRASSVIPRKAVFNNLIAAAMKAQQSLQTVYDEPLLSINIDMPMGRWQAYLASAACAHRCIVIHINIKNKLLLLRNDLRSVFGFITWLCKPNHRNQHLHTLTHNPCVKQHTGTENTAPISSFSGF